MARLDLTSPLLHLTQCVDDSVDILDCVNSVVNVESVNSVIIA